jgi:hypothetical protein
MALSGILRRWVLVNVGTGVFAVLFAPVARAQSGSSHPAEPASGVGSDRAWQWPTIPGTRPETSADNRETGAAGIAPETPQAALTGSTPTRSAADLLADSLFDDIYSEDAQARWTSLAPGTLLTEGWDQPYVDSPVGRGGAPRHGWVNAFGGTFARVWAFAFDYDQGINRKTGNRYVGQYEIFIPFNRRYELEIRSNFIVSNKGGLSHRYHDNIGDTGIISRILLSEIQDFGQTLHLGVFAPTGRGDNGKGVAAIQPYYQFWWNVHGNWAMRGETGVTVPTNHAPTSGYTQYHDLLAIGRYFPGSEGGWFQQWWFYLVATQNSTIAGTPRHETGATLRSGMRCKMRGLALGTGLWYIFASVDIPVTGPGSSRYQPIFAMLYAY